MKKALIIQTAFIGDVILATALVESLAATGEYQLDFLLRKGNESLLENNPALQHVWVWNKQDHKYKELFRLLKNIRKQKYELVINLQRFASTGFLTAFSSAKIKSGFKKNPFSFLFNKTAEHCTDAFIDMHEIERNYQLISFLDGIKPAMPRLYPSDQDYERVKKYQESGPYLCIAPASVWFTKQYPEQKWIDFIHTVPEKYQLILLGGPDDRELCNRLTEATTHQKVINLAAKLNLLESAALMKNAVMNYVNDSAPLHLASAMNAAVTAIFQSTIPSFGFRPLADHSYIVEIKENLSCRPCGLAGKASCPEKHFKCALNIDNQQLLDSLEKIAD